MLGRLYKVMGRVVAAKRIFVRAVQIQPRCVEAMRELRIIDLRSGDDEGGLERIFGR